MAFGELTRFQAAGNVRALIPPRGHAPVRAPKIPATFCSGWGLGRARTLPRREASHKITTIPDQIGIVGANRKGSNRSGPGREWGCTRRLLGYAGCLGAQRWIYLGAQKLRSIRTPLSGYFQMARYRWHLAARRRLYPRDQHRRTIHPLHGLSPHRN